MKLAKPCVDLGLNTNNLEPMLLFWQSKAGLSFDHVLPIRKGVKQYRHDVSGSVLKINHFSEPLPDTRASGYVELLIARAGVHEPLSSSDPDGNRVTLVRPGWEGIEQVAVRMHVRDPEAHRHFFSQALDLAQVRTERGIAFRAGRTLLFAEYSGDAPTDAVMDGKGFRYITFQVFKTDEEHANVLANGGREAMAPRTLGNTARISMVRDPDGNWVEISQRASITGSLEP